MIKLLTRKSTSLFSKPYSEAPFVVISDASSLASFISCTCNCLCKTQPAKNLSIDVDRKKLFCRLSGAAWQYQLCKKITAYVVVCRTIINDINCSTSGAKCSAVCHEHAWACTDDRWSQNAILITAHLEFTTIKTFILYSASAQDLSNHIKCHNLEKVSVLWQETLHLPLCNLCVWEPVFNSGGINIKKQSLPSANLRSLHYNSQVCELVLCQCSLEVGQHLQSHQTGEGMFHSADTTMSWTIADAVVKDITWDWMPN